MEDRRRMEEEGKREEGRKFKGKVASFFLYTTRRYGYARIRTLMNFIGLVGG
jgi:hypothetical protein